MIDLIMYGIMAGMFAVAVYGYFTNLEEVVGKQMILMILLVLTGVAGILDSNL